MNAYKLFDRGSISINQIHFCPICDQYETNTLNYLLETPLKNIEYQVLLRRYGAGGCISIISLKEFKYFLPRFLDLLVEKQNEFLIDIFDMARNTTLDEWTEEEVRFLNLFAKTYIQYILWHENDTYFKYIQDFLEMFQHVLFDTENLSQVCLNHPSSYSLIDYATQKLTGSYENYVEADKSEFQRVKQIINDWNTSQNVRDFFIDRYYKLSEEGYTFVQGNANYVLEWKKSIDQGVY